MPVQLNLIFATSTPVGNSRDIGASIPVNRIVLDSGNYKVNYFKAFLLLTALQNHDHVKVLTHNTNVTWHSNLKKN